MICTGRRKARPLMLAVAAIAFGSLSWGEAVYGQGPAAGAPPGGVTEEPLLTVDYAMAEAQRLIAIVEQGGPEAKEAQVQLQKMISFLVGKQPDNTKARYLAGRMAIAAGRPREAVDLIQPYVNDPAGQTDWYAHKLLGDLKVDNYAKLATVHYKRAVELAPNQPEALIGLAKADLNLDLADSAAENAQKAVLNDKEGKPEYRNVLARAFTMAKKPREAVDAAREAVRLAEEQARSKPGEDKPLQVLKEQYALLVNCLGSANLLFPEDAALAVRLSVALQDQADLERLLVYHQALKVIDAAVELAAAQASVELLLEQARLNSLVGRQDQAMEVLRKVLQANPEQAEAKRLLEQVSGGAQPSGTSPKP